MELKFEEEKEKRKKKKKKQKTKTAFFVHNYIDELKFADENICTLALFSTFQASSHKVPINLKNECLSVGEDNTIQQYLFFNENLIVYLWQVT